MARTSLRTEIVAGVTTFVTMAYIMFANPAILVQAGVPQAGALTATCLGAALATALMAWLTDYPLALAPGMGLNAFLVFTVCLGMGYDWEIGMAVVVLEGLLIAVLVLLGLRRWIMESLPMSLKHAIGVGIGLFIAFIGLKMGGIVAGAPEAFVRLGDLSTHEAIVTIGGLLVTVALMAWGVPGALLGGMVAGTFLADGVFGMARIDRVVAAPDFSTVWKFWRGMGAALDLRLLPVLFAFAVSDFFDTMGTVIGVGTQGGFVDRKGRMPRLSRVLFVDGLAASIGGALGCSSITTYVESASGVAAGGRRGVTALVVAGLFLLAIFLNPLAAAVPSCAVAPALIVVGFLMMQGVTRIAWGKLEDGLPAFLTILLMPLSFSIATGVGWGVLAFVAILACRGRLREIHPVLWVTAGVFAISFSPLVPR